MILSCWRKVISFSTFILILIITSCSGCGSQKVINADASPNKEIPLKSVQQADNYELLPVKPQKIFEIKEDWDLRGKTYQIPQGVTLKGIGGVLKNGTLVGNNTNIKTDQPIFENVTILGQWNAPEISTSLFRSLEEENAIVNVFALADEDIQNTITIDSGVYPVSAKSFGSSIRLKSNSTIHLNGSIELLPNNYDGYAVIEIKGAHNVHVTGNGQIVGDKPRHKGKTGEWGHGLNILHGKDILIENIVVKDCWGDCLYIGNKSSDIEIRNCTFINGRRQGISITYADGVLISNCFIKDVEGTAPQYAIDLEPNKGGSVDNIVVEHVIVDNCYGGFAMWRPDDAYIGSAIFRDCTITGTLAKWPLSLQLAKSVVVDNCIITSDERLAIMTVSVDDVRITNNTIHSKNKKPISVNRSKVKALDLNKIQK